MKEDILAALADPAFHENPIGELQTLAKRLKKSPEILASAPVHCRIAVLSSFMTNYLVEILP